MPVTVEWLDVVVRLLCAMAAGAVLGVNRTERERPAGLRTVILVSLAAASAMILTNLLLVTNGRAADSFITVDPMRLPLGILTGMGFIGAGAILRKGEMVQGVTTAATLWLTTMIGLCFGAGQYLIGTATLALGTLVLWGLKWLENWLPHDRHGTLIASMSASGPTEDAIRMQLLESGFWIIDWHVLHTCRKRSCTIRTRVAWRGRTTDTRSPALIEQLAQQKGMIKLIWKN
jgi:putative Mg2+ transporter-C (MgtC) family protein